VKLESALAAQFKQAQEYNASIGGTHFKEKALHIAARLGVAYFSASYAGSTDFKMKHSIVYRTIR
jgi:hypothetical protein